MGEGSGNGDSMKILLVKTGPKAAVCMGLDVFSQLSIIPKRFLCNSVHFDSTLGFER